MSRGGRVHDSPRPQAADWAAAFAVFCLVVLVGLPALVPFLLIEDPFLAVRASNLVLTVSVFLTGYRWASANGMHALGTGALLASVCIVLVLIAIPLGG